MTGWNEQLVDDLCHRLCADAGLPTPVRRTPIRVWRLSGVERVHFDDGTSVVLKDARAPFAEEHVALAVAAAHGVPVPTVLATACGWDGLGMLLTDLGPSGRPANANDAARAAAHLHRSGPTHGLPMVDEAALRTLPARALAELEHITCSSSADVRDIRLLLAQLDAVAARRAAGAEREPYGLCHGELHHTAVHIGAGGYHLVDWAMAHNGPGVLDLASWYGTRQPPAPRRLNGLIDQYIAAGGTADVGADRGGLPAAVWALAWHRVSVAAWHIRQAVSRCSSEELAVVQRQLWTAGKLLAP